MDPTIPSGPVCRCRQAGRVEVDALGISPTVCHFGSWCSSQQRDGSVDSVSVFPVASVAVARLRFLRLELTRHVTVIRVRQFAKCGIEKVIKEFEALLASD